MGLKSRRKGKGFEQLIARQLREAFPQHADKIERSIQSRGAEASDVLGLPGVWIECQHADRPTPIKKLQQAEVDLAASRLSGATSNFHIPVAVTRRTKSAEILVTLRVESLFVLMGVLYPDDAITNMRVIHMSWIEFVDFYRGSPLNA